MQNFIYNDGGRKLAGYTGDARDCVVRAIAIATKIPYQEVYDAINGLSQSERIGKKKKRKSNARTGVFKPTYKKFLESLGWHWTPTMTIGSGCTVHLRAEELPKGTIVVSVSRHLVTVIDGVINDTHDPSRNGSRCVYGYWTKNA